MAIRSLRCKVLKPQLADHFERLRIERHGFFEAIGIAEHDHLLALAKIERGEIFILGLVAAVAQHHDPSAALPRGPELAREHAGPPPGSRVTRLPWTLFLRPQPGRA